MFNLFMHYYYAIYSFSKPQKSDLFHGTYDNENYNEPWHVISNNVAFWHE